MDTITEQIPQSIIEQLYSEKNYHILQKKFHEKTVEKDGSTVCALMIGNSDRDVLFYHYFLCSLFNYCTLLPKIVLIVNDRRTSNLNFDNYLAHEKWHISEVRALVEPEFSKYLVNPFFYRIAMLLVLQELGLSFEHLYVSDNDILIKSDLRDLSKSNVLCRYNHNDESTLLAELLSRETPDLSPGFYKQRKGSYGDFFFAIQNTSQNERFLKETCSNGLPDSIPTNAYNYWWLCWLRFVNLVGPDQFLGLEPLEPGSKVYTWRDKPILFHVGGGYQKDKISIFVNELHNEPGILAQSPIPEQLLYKYFPAIESEQLKNDWLGFIEQ